MQSLENVATGAEQVFWICAHEVRPLSATVKKMMQDLADAPTP